VLFAAWSIVLVGLVGSWRAFQVLTRQKRANEFPSGSQHGSDVYWRINRAQINAAENLPIFAVVVIASHLANVGGEWLDTACIIVIVARVAQSLIHISSSTSVAVNLRFTAFLTQLVAMGWIITRLVF
jgi:uncharacterized MAPEG superfamily protein